MFFHTLAMDLNGIPLLSLLQTKLGYLNERQKVIAQNVANASTPGYTPHDLKAFADQPGMTAGPSVKPVALAATTASGAGGAFLPLQATSGSGSGSAHGGDYANVEAPDSETTLDGNQVVLEEQMIKMSQARNEYDAAIGFYQKALSMLHMAVQKPTG